MSSGVLLRLPESLLRCQSWSFVKGLQQVRWQSNTSGKLLNPLEEYNRQVKIGKLRDDSYQRGIIKYFVSSLHDKLLNYKPPQVEEMSIIHVHKHNSWRSKLLSRMKTPFGSSSESGAEVGDKIPQGIYLYGDVGCGKTMLMDLFYSTISSHLSKKRIHFHQFMQYVHRRQHEIVKEYQEYTASDSQEVDTIPYLAAEIARKARILCFDEFQVTDVADAMILRRLMSTLLSNEYGVVLFATSNRHPDELYINGVQRKSFIPCIELIKRRTAVTYLNSPTDYRKISRPTSSVYYFPTSNLKYYSRECALFRQHHIEEWYKYFAQAKHTDDSTTGIESVHKTFRDYPLTIWGREFKVPICTPPRVAQFTFKQLCGEPLAAGDYLTLAKNFNVVYVTDIPYLSIYVRDQVRRFITFLDAVYDSDGKLATTGAADFTSLFVEPEAILNDYELKEDSPARDAQSDAEVSEEDELIKKHGFSKEIAKKSQMFALDEERFAFARALSRLTQMSTTDWVSK
ncbi:Afg1p KNAG_0B03740 [Huiozyma naganishii CBS 8797]|uniref:AAA+ ATPase domain-containing protein n=1 Tax=Huiozyma naganishii (strain ATCC MYA-139 / BCRC 22969 / CBS 8797 / KCTC 17520 / NBRC 10181 / NCYC 3082 / Yp74L-3) TaxID=1071383 RepID=J7R1X7_HUIN7|nr:hypothetical protein KNAG_0B03740 [Kazachstania naganishii CBS 8797]CCK68815.1 hypothetical protein KNAG_0B03740 [Kazachstania naganishii CBS 8797]